jgi:hypothetical protein
MQFKKIIYNFFFNKLSNVNSLYNKHKGEECYIIGCGNSIKYIDLKLFNDKPVIGINEIIFHIDFQKLKNKYVVHSEPFFYYPFFQTYSWKSPLFPIFTPTAKFFRKFIRSNRDTFFFIHLSNFLFLRGKNIFYHFFKYPNKEINKKLCTLNPFKGAFNHAVSMAIFLGFKKVILVGCDYTFSPPSGLHFYEKGKGKKVNIKPYNIDFFTQVKKHIEIKTLTIGSKKSILPKVDYFDFKKDKENYKENYKIIEPKTLEALKNTRRGVYNF